jgi:hypothetical protein
VQVWRVMVKNPASISGIRVSEKTVSSTNMISGEARAETWMGNLQRWLHMQKSGRAALDVVLLSRIFFATLQRAVIAVIPVRISPVSRAPARPGLSIGRGF